MWTGYLPPRKARCSGCSSGCARKMCLLAAGDIALAGLALRDDGRTSGRGLRFSCGLLSDAEKAGAGIHAAGAARARAGDC
jgi:hypothetical protein